MELVLEDLEKGGGKLTYVYNDMNKTNKRIHICLCVSSV